jgi:hypothetical protein
MKKIIIVSLTLAAIAGFNACKKKNEVVSTPVKVSYPTITTNVSTEGITKFGTIFSAVNVGASIGEVSATAYDSVLKEVCTITVLNNTVDAKVAGLGLATFTAKNSNGYLTSGTIYVAVTDIKNDWNLGGAYKRASNGALVNVTKLARGFYTVDNVGGAPSLPVVGYFLQTDDSTISFPSQPTENVGDIDCLNEKLKALPGDTSYSWVVDNASFGTATRVFVKQ